MVKYEVKDGHGIEVGLCQVGLIEVVTVVCGCYAVELRRTATRWKHVRIHASMTKHIKTGDDDDE